MDDFENIFPDLPIISKTSAQISSSIEDVALESSSDEYEHDEDTLTEEEINMIIAAADAKIENDCITVIQQET